MLNAVFQLVLRAAPRGAFAPQPAPVAVVVLHVARQGALERRQAPPLLGPEELDLHAGEEALGAGVVPAVPPPRHALDRPVPLEQVPVVAVLVEAALVAVDDHPRGGPRGPEGPPGHREHQLQPGPAPQAVGHDLPVEEVDHRGEVPGLPPDGVLGDVGGPLPPGRGRREVPRQHVGRDARGLPGGAAPLARGAAPGEPERPHAGAHGLGVDRQPLGLELRGDAPVPVAPPVLFVDPRDRVAQRVGPPGAGRLSWW